AGHGHPDGAGDPLRRGERRGAPGPDRPSRGAGGHPGRRRRPGAPEPVRLRPTRRRGRNAVVSTVEVAAWLGAGYSLVLLLVAFGIDLLARRAHTANDEHQTRGFTY